MILKHLTFIFVYSNYILLYSQKTRFLDFSKIFKNSFKLTSKKYHVIFKENFWGEGETINKHY